MNEERKCFKCGIPLTEQTWRKDTQRSNRNICRACTNAYHRAYEKRNRAHWNAVRLAYYYNNKEECLARTKRYQRKQKVLVIEHYSNGTMACANPFEQHQAPYTDIRALEIDHINDDGKKYRKNGHYTIYFYRYLIRNHFPLGYQVLCCNCNRIKKTLYTERQHLYTSINDNQTMITNILPLEGGERETYALA